MFFSKTRIIAAVSCVALSGIALADESNATLEQQVNELKGQVAQLQAKQAASSKEVAATIESVLRDAEKRSTMLAAGESSAGYDNGFFIRSGAFSLQPGIIFQFWNVTDYRSNTSGSKDDEIENGFEVHRIDLSLSGTAFTKDLSYNFMWRTVQDGSVSLQDAFVTYMFADAWGFRAGQFTANFTHEDFMSDGTQLAADRSLLDATIGGYTNRVQGVALLYGNYNEKNPFNAEVCFNDGSNSLNSNYVGHYPGDPSTVDGPMGPGNHAFDWGIYGRVEWKAMGKWADYNDFTAKGASGDLFVLGAAFDYDQGGNGDLIAGTIDAQYKNKNGFALYAALVVRYANDAMTGSTDSTDWGGLLQASYLFNPAWEVFARYAYIGFDNDVVAPDGSTESQFQEITIGVNYYLGNNGSAGHRAKVTIDLNWLPNGAPGDFSGIGYKGDSNFDTEVSLRGAFQLML